MDTIDNVIAVKDLERGNRVELIVSILEAEGYVVFFFLTSPHLYGWVRQRWRYWFIGVRTDVLAASGWTKAAFNEFCRKLIDSSLQDGWHCTPLNDVLLPETDPEVVAHTKATWRKLLKPRHKLLGRCTA